MKRSDIESLVSRLIKSDRYRQASFRVRAYRCSIDPDDLVGELNRGIAMALHSVKSGIGDPMEYLISRGFRHVQSVVSKALNEGVIEECLICAKVRPYRRNPCYTCGSKEFLIHPRFVPLLCDDNDHLAFSEGTKHRTKPLVEAGTGPTHGSNKVVTRSQS